jgi:plastocyanin
MDRAPASSVPTSGHAAVSAPSCERSARPRRLGILAPLLGVALGLAGCGVALGLAGCGGGDDGLPDADVAVVGTDVLTWEPDRLEMSAGTRSVALVCGPGANHNLVIEETGEEVAACTPGRTASGELTLDAGTYVYVCTVPGHEVTMRGVLEVR